MSLRSFFGPLPSGKRKRRAKRVHTIRRLRFETFEDRRMLSFTLAEYDEVYAFPSAIVTADFNEDGRLDLATAGNGNVRVRLGDGAGAFGAPQLFAAGTIGPYQLEVADFNGDENLDILVVYDVLDLGTSLLMGNGDGTFQSPVVTDSSWLEITAVAVGHFNNDGKIDIAVSLFEWDRSGGYFQVRLGDGQGGFTGSYNDPYQPSSLYSADEALAVDLNNDGKLDVVTAGVQVLLGNGDGTLHSETYYPAEVGGYPYPRALATGDFTGDGNADVIVVGNSVAVLRGRGDGSLDAPLYHSANGTTNTAVATADFNADGKLDAVVTDGDTGTVSLMLGNGDGTLRFASAFAIGSLPYAVTVGDFNRDGRPDVAAANTVSHTVSVLLNDGVWPVEPELPGDYSQNGTVDTADYVVWRNSLGQSGLTPYSGADGSGNGSVGPEDYDVWKSHFGQTLPAMSGSGGASVATASATLAATSDDSTFAATSLGSSASKPRPTAQRRSNSDGEQAASPRENPPPVLAPAYSPVTSSRPAPRRSVGAQHSLVGNRQDEALMDWLAAQPSSRKRFENSSGTDWSAGDDASGGGDVHIDTVEQVFALLSRI
jgi:hypothetical protein